MACCKFVIQYWDSCDITLINLNRIILGSLLVVRFSEVSSTGVTLVITRPILKVVESCQAVS